MKKEFSGKTVIVTGGASGMGLLSGQNFFERGANVLLCDCNEEELNKAKALFDGDEKRLLTVLCDVRNFDEVRETVRACIEKFGSLDVMVNCAGGNSCRIFGRWEEFCDLPIEQIRWGVDVNLMGTVLFLSRSDASDAKAKERRHHQFRIHHGAGRRYLRARLRDIEERDHERTEQIAGKRGRQVRRTRKLRCAGPCADPPGNGEHEDGPGGERLTRRRSWIWFCISRRKGVLS